MTGDPAAGGDWSAATHEGLARARRRAIAALTPTERMQWLDAALDLALRSGALARARAERQRRADAAWGSA